MRTLFSDMSNAPFEFQLAFPFSLYCNNCMTNYKGKSILLNQVIDVNTPPRRFFDESQMEIPSGAHNVTLAFLNALETFLVHLQLFATPSSSMFVVPTLKKM
jgi:hypothetical protein